jgi:hypothetical protein
MFWTDGGTYKGEWCAGEQHGYGCLTLANGVVKEGKFVRNKFVDPSEDAFQ